MLTYLGLPSYTHIVQAPHLPLLSKIGLASRRASKYYFFLTCVIALQSLLFIPATQATISIPVSDKDLIDQSACIIIGNITSLESYIDPLTHQPFTLIHLSLEEQLKGNLPSSHLTIKQLGGKVGDQVAWVSGSPEFSQGERVLLFLTHHLDGSLRVAHLFQGKFTLTQDLSHGKEMATRYLQPDGVQVLQPRTQETLPRSSEDTPLLSPKDIRELQQLRDQIKNRLALNQRIPQAQLAPLVVDPAPPSTATVEVVDTFRTLNSSRWFEPDDGNPVIMFMNSKGEPSALGQGFDQIREAYAVWNDNPDSSLAFEDGGFTTAEGFQLDGVNAISFGDPLEQMDSPMGCTGILAIGGFIPTFNETREINGQTFSKILEGDSVFNDGWEGCGFLENFPNFAEVATHELGHVLGLAHSSDPKATMFPTVHFDGRGATITPDDLAGLLFLYPQSTNPPDAPLLHSPTGSIIETSPTYSWNGIPDASLYHFQLINNTATILDQWITPEELGCATEPFLCTFRPTTSLNVGNGEWRIQIAASGGFSEWSVPAVFQLQGKFVEPPAMTSPAPRTVLSESIPTFTWTTGIGAEQYWLSIGSTPGAADLYNQSQGIMTQTEVPRLPTDGRIIHVRLWYLANGRWESIDYQYTARTIINLLAALSPAARSAQVGKTVSLFASIVNKSEDIATGCFIAPHTSIPATFTYQSTDPSTNAPSGLPNTPTTIDPESTQTFLLEITPMEPFATQEIQFNFDCENMAPAQNTTGLNTLSLSASIAPAADMVAIISALDGIIVLPTPTSTEAFLIGSINLGAPDLITMSADTGGIPLPVELLVCEFDAIQGTCMASPRPTATESINTGEITFYAVFVRGKGIPIPLNPASNRIFIRFRDSENIDRGFNSVAVQTP